MEEQGESGAGETIAEGAPTAAVVHLPEVDLAAVIEQLEALPVAGGEPAEAEQGAATAGGSRVPISGAAVEAEEATEAEAEVHAGPGPDPVAEGEAEPDPGAEEEAEPDPSSEPLAVPAVRAVSPATAPAVSPAAVRAGSRTPAHGAPPRRRGAVVGGVVAALAFLGIGVSAAFTGGGDSGRRPSAGPPASEGPHPAWALPADGGTAAGGTASGAARVGPSPTASGTATASGSSAAPGSTPDAAPHTSMVTAAPAPAGPGQPSYSPNPPGPTTAATRPPIAPPPVATSTSAAPPPVTFTGISGPACQSAAAAFHANGFADGTTDGWTRQPGDDGTGSGCGNGFLAMPMSGASGKDYVNSSVWTFTLNPVTAGSCAVTVFVPQPAAGKSWEVGGTAALYSVLFGASSASLTETSTFTVNQAANRGGAVVVSNIRVQGPVLQIRLHDRGIDYNTSPASKYGVAAVQVSCTQH